MKRLFCSFLTIAATLSAVTSCRQDEPNGNENTFNASFTVSVGQQTKSFSDGTVADRLYAGVYELGSSQQYTWVADNSSAPSAITGGSATVSFDGKLVLSRSYLVVFWAQKEGAPYDIDWAKNDPAGPTVTATCAGSANDESRDAFYGIYETGTVTGDINLTGSAITLKRPFAQINVLVPTGNLVDPTASVTSSMSVSEAPTVLNLATKATSDPADWTFSSAAIDEDVFEPYTGTHKYAEMNYVLVDQINDDACYDITFSATSSTQSVNDKQVKDVPLQANRRTNIVGDIFNENFEIISPVVIDREYEID